MDNISSNGHDLPLLAWPQVWGKRHPPSYVWASTVPFAEDADAESADIRGHVGIVEFPILEGASLDIILMPKATDAGLRCELPIVGESALSARQAGCLTTAMVQIMHAQDVDEIEAICFLTQLHVMLKDWISCRQGGGLAIESQPILPGDAKAWGPEEHSIAVTHTSMPMSSIDALLESWHRITGRWIRSFPGANVEAEQRFCYTQIPARVLSASGVEDVYGVPAIVENAGCAIRSSANAWTVTYGGSAKTWRSLKGMGYIVHLIKNPGRVLSADELLAYGSEIDEQAAKGASLEALPVLYSTESRLDAIDPDAKISVPKLESVLRNIELKLETELDIEEKEDLESKKKILHKYIHDVRQPRDTARKNRINRVEMAIRRAREKTMVDHKAFDLHLKSCLKIGSGEFCYVPEEGVDWAIDT